MPEPEKWRPLASYHDRFKAATNETIAIREYPFAAQVNLRGDPDAPEFTAAVERIVGCGLLRDANTVCRTADAERAILWLGPDEWLIVAGEGEGLGFSTELENALSSRHTSVIDVSANRTVIEIAGRGARDHLAKGCSLDLHASAFAVDHCAQTLLANVQVIIEQTDDAPTFRIYVRPSFSRYLADWLLEAMARI